MRKIVSVFVILLIVMVAVGAAAEKKPGEARKSIEAKLNAAFNGATMPPESDYISLMDDLSYRMKSDAKRRAKNDDVYWKVTVDDLVCNSDFSSDEEDAVIVNIDLTWDGMNGVPRTKKMLRLFGDDMANTLYRLYSDENITQLWCRWSVPYLVNESGFIAKYKYERRGDKVYMTDSNGQLFSLPDNYK